MTKIKVSKVNYHIILETPNGAGYAFPVEVVKGMMSGEIASKYESACEFLNGEDRNAHLTVEDVRKAFEEAVHV